MNFKIFFPLFLLSCGFVSDPSPPVSLESDIRALETTYDCHRLKFPRDIAFNGSFLFHFFLCSSQQTNGESSLFPAMTSIVRRMGVGGMDNLADLFKVNSSKNRYPLVESFSTILHRGVYENKQLIPGLYSSRFTTLQQLAMKFNPYWMGNLVFDMNRTGHLEKILNELNPLMNTLDNQTLLAFFQSVLTDSSLRESLVEILKEWTEKNRYQSVKDIFSLADFNPSINTDDCLKEWIDPIISSKRQYCSEVSSDRYNPADLYKTLLENLGEKKIKAMTVFFSSLIKDFLSIPSEERYSVILRLSHAIKGMMTTHDSPWRFLLAWINYFLKQDQEGRYVVSSHHADLLMETLKKMIEVGEGRITFTVNQKLGRVKLQDDIWNFLWKGGTPKNCLVTLPGLSQIELKNTDEFFSLIHQYFAPHPQCPQNISPISAHILSLLKDELECQDSCESLTKKMIDHLFRADWDDLKENRHADPMLSSHLLVSTFMEIKEELKKDTRYLYWLRMANSDVSPSEMDQLIAMVKGKPLTPENIAHLDFSLNGSVRFNMFKKDFLENILHWKINRLGLVLEQFTGIMETTDQADLKFQQIIRGLYNEGPLERLIHSRLYSNLLSSRISEYPSSPRVNELLFLLRNKSGLLKNKYFNKTENISFPDPSSNEYAPTISYKKEDGSYYFDKIDLVRPPFGFEDYFVSKNVVHTLDETLINSSMLSGHNVEKSDGESFVDWLENHLYPHLIDVNEWHEYIPAADLAPIETTYFKTTPYSINESRKLALFYSKNLLYVSGTLPSSPFHMEKILQKRVIRPQFLSYKMRDTRRYHWIEFQKNTPDFSDNSLSDLAIRVGHLAKEGIHLPWASLPKKKEYRDLSMLSDREKHILKILSSSGLLTISNDGRYMPLIGVDGECHLKDNPSIPCPIKFLQDGPSSPQVALGEYVGRRYVEPFCPLLASSSDLSADLVRELSLHLKLEIGNMEDHCLRMKENNLLFYDSEKKRRDLPIPLVFHEKILFDLFYMGKNPRLAPGLSLLPARIRLAKKYHDDKKEAFFEIINTRSVIPVLLRSFSHRIVTNHHGYFITSPDGISEYLDFMEHFLSKNSLSNALALYGGEIKAMDQLGQTIFEEFLTEFLIPHYNRWTQNNKDRPIIEFFLDAFLNMDKKYLQMISQILSSPESSKSIVMVKQFVFFILDFTRKISPDSYLPYWKRDSIKLLQAVSRKELWVSLGELIHPFHWEEIKGGLNSIVGSLKKTDMNSRDIMEIFTDVTEFFTHWSMGKTETGIRIQNMEKSLQSLFTHHPSPSYYKSLDRVMDAMNSHLPGFDGKKSPSLSDQSVVAVDYLIHHMIPLMNIYQEYFTRKDFSDDYGRYTWMSFGDVLNHNSGFMELASFLKDRRLGTWRDVYRPLFFGEERKIFLKLLLDMTEFDLSIYQKALSEMDEFLIRSNKMISFIDNRIVPDEQTSIDVLVLINTLNLMIEDGVWNKNKSLLEDWFKDWEDSLILAK